MHISTVNLLKLVKESENITIAVKLEVMCDLSIGIFKFDLDFF